MSLRTDPAGFSLPAVAVAPFRGLGRLPLLGLLVAFTVSLPAAEQSPPFREGFRLALPGYTFEFPRDHGSHDAYRTEWWYYTGHLLTRGGRRAGFELTFFRVGIVPPASPPATGWDLRNLALAHFAVSDLDRKEFRYYEKLNRSSRFTAEARSGRLDVFNEGWSARGLPNGEIRIIASAGGDSIDLVLRPQKPPVIHGENGISVKAPGIGFASHYYSFTRLSARGSVTLGGRQEECEGLAWMDHEFGSSVLRENQQGWNWFSIQFDNDTELMLYQIRRADGSPDVTSSGTLVLADGNVIHLRREQFTIKPVGRWTSPRSRASYPMGWKIEVMPLDISLTIDAEFPAQELITSASTGVTYWEGAVRASGRFGGTPIRGAGYVEMTGYDRPFGR
ncbi:MAG TPA: lipocalin-like domain-containing protein [Thermoanaerobaculia bacterium]|nr:lipocalin-like domain-containing protein [Thermoanaerobaculia bacterium]